MAPPLSPSKRRAIHDLKLAGWTHRDIASRYSCSPQTVGNIIAKLELYGTPYYITPGRGRKTKFSDRDLRRMKILVDTGKARDGSDVHKMLGMDVHPSTVRRKLAEMGLNGRIRRKVPYLSARTKRLRRQWVAEMLERDPETLIRIVFSDESKFLLFGSDGKRYCRRRIGEAFLERNVSQRVKHGGGKVNVWGCVTWNGVGKLYRVQGNLERFQYLKILKGPLGASLRKNGLEKEDIIFQQDNDPKHTSKVVKAWLEESEMEILPWAPYSPDMNIIEHVWSILEANLRKRNPPSNQ